MTCPECGLQMWNYEVGQMRCTNDHVFSVAAIEGVAERVIRIDRPSLAERLMDFAAGCVTGCILVVGAVVILGLA